MTEQAQSLHRAYCETMQIELVLMPLFATWWGKASVMGVTPDDVKLCLQSRIRLNQNREPKFRAGLEIKHLVRDEEAIASMLNEAAIIKTLQRKKTFPPGKVEVLKATGRDPEPDQGTRNRHISEVFKDIPKQ